MYSLLLNFWSKFQLPHLMVEDRVTCSELFEKRESSKSPH